MDPAATPEQRLAAAQAALAASTSVTALESAALKVDPRVTQARAQLATATESLRKARETYAGALHDDPAWQAASQDVAQRQKDAADAESKLAEVRKVIADQIAARN